MTILLKKDGLKKIRDIDPKLVSYNIEFAEVTGGTFWKSYTPEQIAGTEEFYVASSANGIESMYKDLMQTYPPIDLYNEKLRYLAKEIGEVWVRVSGTWATKTYYDFDGLTNGKAPEGYLNVLTKKQWIGVLDFIKNIGGHLLISVANCPGLHSADEPWKPSEAEKIFSLSQEYGVPIEAAEFANEPNLLEDTGFPPGYTAADYRRDQDLFFTWLEKNYPDCIKVGPCSTGGDNIVFGNSSKHKIGGMEQIARHIVNCSDLLDGTKIPLDIFSYHYYNGLSDRLASVVPSAHWDSSLALSEDYLAVAGNFCKTYIPLRDRFVPNAPVWVTESGDAGGGGDTWASTYLDVPRTLNELGVFASLTNGIIFHNTLASSDYAYLERGVFNPRPNYFAVILWNRLMGTTVYNSEETIREGVHVFVHSRRDGKQGKAYLIINNSTSEDTIVNLPTNAEVYVLEGKDGQLRSQVMTLNGKDLALTSDGKLPALESKKVDSGEFAIPKTSCTFILM